MHDDSPDSADRRDTAPSGPGAQAEAHSHSPEADSKPPEDPLIAQARAFVMMLEQKAESIRERRRRRHDDDDIPADVPRLRGWR